MKRALLLLALAAWSICNPPCAHGEAQLALISDVHSHTFNLEAAVLLLALENRDYLDREPGGTPILAGLGDLAGMSPMTESSGKEIWDFLLAMGAKDNPQDPEEIAWEVLTFLGNHEGFDENGGRLRPYMLDGNQIFHRDALEFRDEYHRVAGRPNKIINTSIPFTPAGAQVFERYRDVTLRNGQKTRFIGLVLEEFFSKCLYKWDSPCQLFKSREVLDHRELVRKHMEKGRRDKVDAMFLMSHDYMKNVQGLKLMMDQIAGSAGPGVYPKPAIGAAAHDHIADINEHAGVIDAGSNFRMVLVEFDKDFERKNVRAITQGDLDAVLEMYQDEAADFYPSILNKHQQDLLRKWRPTIERKRIELSKDLGIVQHYLANKEETKRGPTTSGEISADTLVLAGQKVIQEFWHSPVNRYKVLDVIRQKPMIVVSFYNSSSFRNDYSYNKGTRYTQLKKALNYGFRGEPEILVFDVKTVIELYKTLQTARKAKDGTFTPQLPSHVKLREAGGGTRLYIQVKEGQEIVLSGKQKVALVIDSFLAINGYHVPEWDDLLKKGTRLYDHDKNPVALPEQTEVMDRFDEFATDKQSCLKHLLAAVRDIEDKAIATQKARQAALN